MELPVIKPVAVSNIPVELTAMRRWVCWTYFWSGKWTKIPTNPLNGYFAKVNDSSTWGTFSQAMKRFQDKQLAGIGYVLRKEDPFCALDLDDCREEDWAHEIIRRLNSYTERSPSGSGYRIFIRGKLPNAGRRKNKLEIYDDKRFVTVTGDRVDTAAHEIRHCQEELNAFYTEWFPVPPPKLRTEKPDLNEWQLFSRIVMGAHGEKFADLNEGNIHGYPSPSEADLAFCAIVAMLTNDPAQIDNLYRRSKLYREKWDEHRGEQTYGELTIHKALGG